MDNREDYTDPYDVDAAVDDWSEIHSEDDADENPEAPYSPPRVPLGLPNVVRFATESGDLSWKERSIVIMLARWADPDGRASVAVSTLCKIMRIGSKNTVEKALTLAAHPEVGILRKESGKGGNGKARKSNVYTFLGKERNWQPLPQTRPGVPPVVALARANKKIEEQGTRIDEQDALIRELRAELDRLSNGHSADEDFNGRPMTDDEDFNGHKVTDETGQSAPETLADSYESSVPEASQGSRDFIGHKELTNENPEDEGQAYLDRRAWVEALLNPL